MLQIQLCDEIGILAWTENVFACGAYPIEPKPILDNILAETAENVQRLNRHPSFALWAGNNEVRHLSHKNQSVPHFVFPVRLMS